jgi:hypothetical protein
VANTPVQQVYARNVNNDARALIPNWGWRQIAGATPEATTNILLVLSDTAMNNRTCNVFIGFGGTILSVQAPFPPEPPPNP